MTYKLLYNTKNELTNKRDPLCVTCSTIGALFQGKDLDLADFRFVSNYLAAISTPTMNKNIRYLLLPIILIIAAWVYTRYLGDSPKDLMDKKLLNIESFLMASLIFVAVFT